MNARILSKFIILLSALAFNAGEPAQAQVRLSDVPPDFFAAQRGRIVARHNGGFRLRYGRGLTPEGASVLTNAITTFGPIVGTLVNPAGAPMEDPLADAPAAAPECLPMEADAILDDLRNQSLHGDRIARLDTLNEQAACIVRVLGLKPVERSFASPVTRVADGSGTATKPVIAPDGNLKPGVATVPPNLLQSPPPAASVPLPPGNLPPPAAGLFPPAGGPPLQNAAESQQDCRAVIEKLLASHAALEDIGPAPAPEPIAGPAASSPLTIQLDLFNISLLGL